MNLGQYALSWQHIGIPVKDIDQSIAFYESLGFLKAYQTVYGTQAVCFMQLKDMTIELYSVEAPAMQTGAIDHICICVSDVDAVFQAVHSSGEYKLLDEKVDCRPFWKNGVRFFTIEGPSKEKLEFSQYL